MATSCPTMPSHLHFPAELWSLTIHHFRHRKSPADLTYLWTTVRQVSKQFRQEIEEIFRTKHLPRTWVHVDTGESSRALPLSPTKISLTWSFAVKRLCSGVDRPKLGQTGHSSKYLTAKWIIRYSKHTQTEHTFQMIQYPATTSSKDYRIR